jgi:hypothetical protein
MSQSLGDVFHQSSCLVSLLSLLVAVDKVGHVCSGDSNKERFQVFADQTQDMILASNLGQILQQMRGVTHGLPSCLTSASKKTKES